MAPSSTAAAPAGRHRGLITGLVILAAVACIVLVVWVMGNASRDPYVQATRMLNGDADHGGQVFRINCAGCHGIAAQGLVGPNLHGVADRRSDPSLIHQVVSGATPPMPRFEVEPQTMADLLAYLKSLE
ncbi:cytochrome cM [Synechococcus sp. RS9909]|uniref:c-type cytochrome n=1 Tax=unclassified Synechococcus TaxID=2626047 RepID=UPI0000690E08|nr:MULTISPECIES: cytochrome c [unclassified Synechococcus]EAQ68950.1 cytochrome cM [Synechococcus sp. RS9917]QNI78910.1 cytochrome cM [Synechococcus sp. RS9909]